jgi:radical SAM protein with 4Fe4S-binding SPASM domain
MTMEKANLLKFGRTILQIETIAACNMSCCFCPYALKEDKRSILPSNIVHHILDEINPKQDGFEYVTFSQFNEPLLDRRIFDFIGHANDNGIPVLFITNGLLLSKASIRLKLLQAIPAQIKISIQTLDRRSFCSARGTTTTFEEYIGGIAAFLNDAKGAAPEVTLDVACNFLTTKMWMVKTILGLTKGDPSVPSSVNELHASIEEFLADLGHLIPNLSVKTADVFKFLRGATPYYISEQGYQIAKNIRLKIKPFMYGRRITEFHLARHPIICNNRMLGVLADGSVVPCCLIYNSTLSLGNVRDKSLREIIEGKASFLLGLRDKASPKPLICRKCLGQPTRRGVIAHKILAGLGLA